MPFLCAVLFSSRLTSAEALRGSARISRKSRGGRCAAFFGCDFAGEPPHQRLCAEGGLGEHSSSPDSR